MNAKEVLTYCREKGVQAVDLRFVDLPGTWQHTTIPISELSEDVFENGLGFDGSSIRGWKSINESDMLIVPQPDTVFLDPFTEMQTLCVICNIQDPITGEDYSRDPRHVASKAVGYLNASNIADTAYFGPEAEFFIFNSARFSTASHEGFYHLDSIEGKWNTGAVEGGANLAYKPRHKEGYFPVPPTDTLQDIRTEMMLTLTTMGGGIEANLERWVGQFQLDSGDRPRRDTLSVDGEKSQWLDVRGTFRSQVGDRPGPPQDGRLLGVAIPMSRRPFLLKLVGPRAAVSSFEAEFRSFVRSGQLDK